MHRTPVQAESLPGPGAVSAWGTAPTPLAPRACRESHGDRRAAHDLRSAAGEPDLSLRDLDTGFWEKAPWQVAPKSAFRSLRLQLASLPRPRNAVAVPEGAEIGRLLALPLGVRTTNVLKRLVGTEHGPGETLRTSLTAADVLDQRGAGVMVLLELLAVVEAAEGLLETPARNRCGDTSSSGDRTGHELVDAGTDESLTSRVNSSLDMLLEVVRAARLPDSLEESLSAARTIEQRLAQALPDRRIEALQPMVNLLALAREFHGARTVADALGLDLSSLATRTGLRGDLHAVRIETLLPADATSHTHALLTGLDSLLVDDRQRIILERRTCRRQPATLRALGRGLGITRERVRQIERKLNRSIEASIGPCLQVVAGAAAHLVDPIAPPEEVDRQLEVLFDEQRHWAVPLACRMLRKRLAYKVEGRLDLNEEAREAVSALRSWAASHADDAGLLVEEEMKAALPDSSWIRHWDLLVEACKLHSIDGLLGLRSSQKARVKAAVLNIGRLATAQEIAARCGLTRQKTAAALSNLPSVDRADRERWGLTEWIEDVYEGVANEILQRIDENGGSVQVDHVIKELHRLFDTPEATVRAYLGTPQFEVADGWVRRANTAAIRLRALDDVIDGRDDRGRAWWGFRMEARYLEGYSVANVPPELARALGCTPNGGTELDLAAPSGCRPLSLRWRLTSLGGASIGHVRKPLEILGVRDGETVHLILRDDGAVELASEPEAGARVAARTPGEILRRIKQRRRILQN